MNGDGKADLILPNNHTNTFRYWQNTGNAGNVIWAQADSIMHAIIGNKFIAFADLDNDHDLDAITHFDSRLKLYWNTGNASKPNWQLDPEPFTLNFYNGYPNNIRFADIDQDGFQSAGG